MSWQNYTLKSSVSAQRDARADKATLAQMDAMRPDGSVQVAASAGTGKTHVLTRRFLRLLLEDPRLQPSEILAVTYTKAGATEMRNRLTEMLAEWAVMPENNLAEKLSAILEKYPNPQTLRRARSLFTEVLDDPVGIRVMTVHSFCQSLLAQFPLEAGVNAGFRILEGREAEALLQEKVAETYTALADWTPDDSPYWWAFSYMVTNMADASLQSEFKAYIENRRRFERLFEEDSGGGLEGVLATLADALEIDIPQSPPEQTLSALEQKHLEAIDAHKSFLKSLADALVEDKGVNAQKAAADIYAFLAASEDIEKKEALLSLRLVFETTAGEPRKKIIPAEVARNVPGLPDAAREFHDFWLTLDEERNKYLTYFKTASYLVMAYNIGQRYAEAKTTQGYLDFEDLIRYSKKLLTGGAGKAEWVRFKMDGRISHIMLDEAQDTDSDQWDIVRALIEEFYTGIGQHEEEGLKRTFFAVGDGKQAIYRFRGAERHVFEGMLPEVNALAKATEHEVRYVDLNTSFRSSDVILDFVDTVFSSPESRKAIDGKTEPLKHEAFHLGAGGRVEILPPEPRLERPKDKDDGWKLPIPDRRADKDSGQKDSPRKTLFTKLAARVRALVDEQPFLATEGRFLAPSDIMILCRTSAQIDMFLSTLAAEGVTASKTGDLALEDAPTVMDIMAVLRFLANPNDDLSLLHALRSPLFGLTDSQLEHLRSCHEGGGAGTYFKTLCRLKEPDYVEKTNLLKELLNQVDLATPHQLVQAAMKLTEGRGRLLQRYTGATTGAAAEAISQAIDSFLDATLDYSGKEGTSLIGFLHWFDQGGLRVKIEGGVNKSAVQVMTAHASKGLQAPVVIIPEAASDFYSQSKKEYKLWRVDPVTNRDDLFLFGMKKEARTGLQESLMKAEEERVLEDEMRLLYVALTRAQEMLILAGTENSSSDSWYSKIKEQVSEDSPGWQKLEDGTLLYEKPHLFEGVPKKPATQAQNEVLVEALPAWVAEAPAKEQKAQDVLATNTAQEESQASKLLEGESRQKFRRGLLVHRLLEALPGIEDDKTRREKGMNFLSYSGGDFSEAKQRELVESALQVIHAHPDLFADGYRPETTLAVRDDKGGRLKGRVDCLRVTDACVYIVDYKTDMNPPAGVPAAYKKQLKAYAQMASSIWPERQVRAGILWTTPTPPKLDWIEI